MSSFMTNQEIFDEVAKGIIKQGCPSYKLDENSNRPICCYRSPTGERCAIGMLIPDEIYDEITEGIGIYRLLSCECPLDLRAIGINDDTQTKMLLHYLQEAHDFSCEDMDQNARDEAYFLEMFKNAMRGIAKRYKLDDSALQS